MRKIVKYFLEKEYKKISKKDLIDFLPCILENIPEDMEILKTWEEHLQKLNLPYCIISEFKYVGTSHQNTLILFKRKIV